MKKVISISECSKCPYFAEFPAEVFDGDCSHLDAPNRTRDTRIRNKDLIPDWCPI